MRKSKIKQITLAVCLSLMPLAAFSAGLGKINVTSGLGEPLIAEIDLLSVSPEELSTLIATIASDEAYNAQGIPRLAIHNNIKTEVSKSASGSPIIKIRSSQPINDPYLDMLIQVDWASGRLQREYTVLLDPPGYKPAQVANMPVQLTAPVVSTPSNTLTESARTTIEPEKEVKKSSPITAKQAAKAINTEPQAEPAFDSVTTQPGDTLGEIAKQMQPEGVSLDQMLVGLYENNKSAFSGGNMNRLKVGQIIKMPSREVLIATSEKQATKLVRAQSANWNEYRNSLAGVVNQLPATEEAEQKQTASGKIVTTEDKAITPKAGPQDVVKLSAGELDKQKASKDTNKEFEAKIAALQEETIAREKSLKEAQERTDALEKQIQDMQKLLALKSQNMAQIQKNATDQKAAEESAKPATDVVASSNEKAPVVIAAPVAKVSVPNAAEVNTKPAAANPEKATPLTTAPEVETSLVDTVLGFIDTTILAAIAIIGLLGAGWMYLRNKRKKDLDSFERGILTSGGLRANTVFGNTTSATSNSDTSFLTDFAQSADGSMIDTNDVDPIAEAEVYMAYGRDAQAEEILKDAITKEPKRYELHLKLLEMYASRKDTSAFEAIAGELYTTLGSDDPTWAKLAVIGAEMEPENPLYDISKISVAPPQATAQKLDASDFDNVDLASDLDLDFSAADQPMGTSSAVTESFSSAEKVEQGLSFDMGSLDTDSSNSESFLGNNPQALDDSVNNSMDFDLGDFADNTEAGVNAVEANESASTASSNVMDTTQSMPAFDLPAMDMPTAEIDASGAPVLEAKADNMNEFNMDFELPAEFAVISPEQASVEDVSFDFEISEAPKSSEAEELAINTVDDFSFDLPLADESIVESNAASREIADDNIAPTAKEFDLSAINFDLGDAATTTTDEISPAASSNMAFEDVEIKLDLVAAYIDMDDKEGARELLAEIMDEGGALQQARAKQLLDSLA